MRFEKKIETVNIFRIQVKMSTFVQFQLKVDENKLKVNKKITFFGGGRQKYYSRKWNLSKKKEFDGTNVIRKFKI